nr:sensor domain-containing diguanylate cyclase [Maliibacterium massiliense]
MKKNVLMRTNLLVCIVIILGFATTSIISYRSNQSIIRKDVESVTTLTSEGIYHQIDSIFLKPVNISLTMANDSLLKAFLREEQQHADETRFVEGMRQYLAAYRDKYQYDSVFLASAQTNQYYYYNGLDRTLLPDDPENVWFYQFLQGERDYELNIDNDEVGAANNEITVFINARIRDAAGKTIGVVGVGFRVNDLQALFQSYEEKFGVDVCLVDRQGVVQISTQKTGYEASNLFDGCAFTELKDAILQNREDAETFWYDSDAGSGYLVSAYVQNMDWHLIVQNDTTAMDKALALDLAREILIIAVIVATVLVIITSVMRKYNRHIIELTVAREQEHRNVLREATEQMYEDIYEIDITHNRAASEATEAYFESLGARGNMPFDKALAMIAQRQIKEEFRQGYLAMFSPEAVLAAYHDGVENLRYDFMISTDGQNYHWIRITAHIFYWDDDNSVRLLVYRQNIDAEKKRELYLFDQMQKDSLTELFNKAATQENIRAMLMQHPDACYAFFILDIDNFKQINDQLGHAMGDTVLATFARAVQAQFRSNDIVGRIGGDEFVAFLPVPSRQIAEKKAQELVAALRQRVEGEGGSCAISVSLGVALAPEMGRDFETLYRQADSALYQAKKRGKNGYSIYNEEK